MELSEPVLQEVSRATKAIRQADFSRFLVVFVQLFAKMKNKGTRNECMSLEFLSINVPSLVTIVRMDVKIMI